MIEVFGIVLCLFFATISALCALFCRKTSTCTRKALNELLSALKTNSKG